MNALTTPLSLDSFAPLLPRDLRRHAGDTNFTEWLHSAPGPIRLGSWTASASRGGRTTFDATFGISNSIHSATATTYGPIDALTSMLYDAGFHIEIISFHQQSVPDGRTITFVLAESNGRQHWSMGTAPSSCESSIRAIIGAANLLHG